jgi:disulfide bond formation protein DsbB
MSLEQYSLLLTIGVALLTTSIVLAVLVPTLRQRVLALGYPAIIFATLTLSLSAVLGALVYEFVYLTPVCVLCWWQRVFLFPVVVIAAAALYSKEEKAHLAIGALSLGGLGFALYHYWNHYQGLVVGTIVALPCDAGSLLGACSQSPVLTFGFVTIPLMGVATFISLTLLSFLAHKGVRVY